MSMGVWDPLEERYRPGLYNRFIATAMSRVKTGPRGIVGIPIRADWGPIGEMVEIISEKQIDNTFSTGGTVYLLKRILLAGKRFKPNKIVAYRMATTTAAAATVTVEDKFTLTAKYKGARGNNFSVSIVENIIEESNVDVRIFEGATLLSTYTVAKNDIDTLVSNINADTNSVVTARKEGSVALSEVANIALEGGDSGSELTASNYLDALEAFEPVLINLFVLDGVTDPDILLSVRSWVRRVRTTGKEVMFVQGGSHEDDKDPAIGNQRSYTANYEGVVNVISGTVKGVTRYNSAETACQVAGLIAGCPINKAVTYKELEDVEDVTVQLSNEQIITALRMGSFVLTKDVDAETNTVSVKVEQGINTLTVYPEGRNEKFSKIRVIRTLDAIDYDTGYWAAKNVIGELDNNPDGQATLISGIKLYLETLAGQNAISEDFLTGLDSDFITEGSVVYLATKALPIDSIEQIFNSIYV